MSTMSQLFPLPAVPRRRSLSEPPRLILSPLVPSRDAESPLLPPSVLSPTMDSPLPASETIPSITVEPMLSSHPVTLPTAEPPCPFPPVPTPQMAHLFRQPVPVSPFIQRMKVAVKDPVLIHAFTLKLNSVAFGRQFSFKDVIPHLSYGVQSYKLATHVGWSLMEAGIAVAQVLHAAAHRIDLDGPAAQFIPAHLPTHALREVRLAMPTISLLISYPGNPFTHLHFPTRIAAIRAAERFSDFVLHGLLYLAECILRSRVKGANSVWDFGRIIGITAQEFYARIAARDQTPVVIADPPSTSFCYFSGLDLEIARILRPWCTSFGVIESRTQIGVALYPVIPFGGPMDIIASTGTEMMEEDYADTVDRVLYKLNNSPEAEGRFQL